MPSTTARSASTNCRMPERTLHIDSKVLEKAESQVEAAELDGQDGADEQDEESQAPVRKLTKDQQAELLRRMVDTVGKAGEPGGQIQNVISVGMLSEGWDAKTVTHIMGLRAFSSQLLCEQVVGRGLRRTSYDVDPETGHRSSRSTSTSSACRSPSCPTKAARGRPHRPRRHKTQIEPVAEKRQYEITWPNVIRIDHAYTPVLILDMARVPPLAINAGETATLAELAP